MALSIVCKTQACHLSQRLFLAVSLLRVSPCLCAVSLCVVWMNKLKNRWDDQHGETLSDPELLLYRSHLLGSDLSITNFGGGNTSAKLLQPDPLTLEDTEVLWVKGSGGDLGSMAIEGFATAYLAKLLSLEARYQGLEQEDDMVAYLPHCTFNNNPCSPSIDTPLHAFLPFPHVDHMHPDAIIAIAASKRSKQLTETIFSGQLGWLPWQRPGFDLGLRIRDLVVNHTAQDRQPLRGIVLAGHGLFTWGETSKHCYENTLWAIDLAQEEIDSHSTSVAFGGLSPVLPDIDARTELVARLMPVLRASVSESQTKVGHFNDSPEILEFVNSANLETFAALGTSCPDHFLRTKIRPMIVPFAVLEQTKEAAKVTLDKALLEYRVAYADYYQKFADADSPAIRDPNPVVFLIPGIGMITFANNKTTARVAAEFYVNAVNVMREADRLDEYIGLPEKEAFSIEYWALEEAKLLRLPKPKALSGRIALVTGAVGAIGAAVAERLLREGAAVVLTDFDFPGLERVAENFQQIYGKDNVYHHYMDVTDELSVAKAFAGLTLQFGGVDILVASAGIASASPFEDMTVADWEKNFDVLGKGYFLAAREGYRLMQCAGSGSIIFIGSKNGLAAASEASAYASAKAAELHLARCLALEGAAFGIRVNSVNPDAVLAGSKIWSSEWRSARAKDNGIHEDQLADHYRKRSLLKKEVLPENVAEAVYFFASDASEKSTGNIINVDSGNAAAFPR